MSPFTPLLLHRLLLLVALLPLLLVDLLNLLLADLLLPRLVDLLPIWVMVLLLPLLLIGMPLLAETMVLAQVDSLSAMRLWTLSTT